MFNKICFSLVYLTILLTAKIYNFINTIIGRGDFLFYFFRNVCFSVLIDK